MATTELETLFAAVLRDPEADAPRLAYAAACQAEGERDRAEFIRLQMAWRDFLRAGRDYRDSGRPDVHREIELKKLHGAAWAGPLADRVRWYLFYRGFVEEIALDAAQFLATADELYRLAPIRRLSLTGVAPVLDQLARSPHLARIVTLNLENQRIGDRGVELLASSPHLGKLAWLDLSVNEVTGAGLEALAASDKLPSLRNVIFDCNPVSEEVKEPVDDDAGRVAAVGDIVFDVEKRHGRKTWLHPVLDNGGQYLREEAL